MTDRIHTVKPLDVRIPKGRLTMVTGVSGSGKTTLVLESLVPALENAWNHTPLPAHVKEIGMAGIRHVKLIDASPIGINIRSTVATYCDVHDELRKLFARQPSAKEAGLRAGDFSYNTGSLRCKECDGTGIISLDVQFLPDVDIPCPLCRGSRYDRASDAVRYHSQDGKDYTISQIMDMNVTQALAALAGQKSICSKLQILEDLGLGYLTLGEATPGLSGGEAQRLKLASEMTRPQEDSLFVFDEPTIGLHPLDVMKLTSVFQTLVDRGATVVVIEHDLDLIHCADWIIDMGPGGGEAGGMVVACGNADMIKASEKSITGRYL